ncbi:MAG: hydroxyectoine utilization dehydratase EutB [Azospirillaceae bacterium]
MLTLADIYAARARIRGIAVETPLVPSALSETTGQPVFLKLETTQPTGAFKLRGAANAIAALDDAAKAAGVVCCSTGNHGRGVAHAAHLQGIRAVVCLSELVPAVKADAIAALGAEVRRVGRSQDDALAETRRLAETEGLTEISPFDDAAVVAGQGTAGLEILAERPEIGTILVPLSGGGLASGVAVAAKAIRPDIRVVGITMDRGAAMYESIRAGRPVEVAEVPSLADSLGGGISLDNRLTFGICRNLLEDIVLVTEAEIYRGMRDLFFRDRIVAEGASAVGHAAILAGGIALDRPTAILVTGRNVDMDQFMAVMRGEPVRLGDLTVGGDANQG